MGGWGATIFLNGMQHDLWGGERDTTNNRMEMTACIRAIEFMMREVGGWFDLTIITDSQYVTKNLVEHLPDWKRRGWRLSANKEPVNLDLWKRIDYLNQAHWEWRWVKGHAGVPGNEHADYLATQGIALARERYK